MSDMKVKASISDNLDEIRNYESTLEKVLEIERLAEEALLELDLNGPNAREHAIRFLREALRKDSP